MVTMRLCCKNPDLSYVLYTKITPKIVPIIRRFSTEKRRVLACTHLFVSQANKYHIT